ncbi:dephospho-CoA kinase [Yoonia sp. SS1-5]|uniref:Dephospho-CoA kinase n=1 Tax=Yoonia rhodophyticola TaxID=3137370 RepID=A0AAN0MAU4_9RHOB
MTHLLGLTGSIGMGKSTTAAMFRDAHIPVWDADAVVHALYGKGGGAVTPMRQAFPDAVEGDAISRDMLKQIIAKDPSALEAIENIVHPLVAKDRAAFIAAHDDPLLVFDIPLLYETNADQWLDTVLVVSASPADQRARVLARPGMTIPQFEAMLERQMPDAEKRRRADHLIETQTLDQTRNAVRELIEQLKGHPNA